MGAFLQVPNDVGIVPGASAQVTSHVVFLKDIVFGESRT